MASSEQCITSHSLSNISNSQCLLLRTDCHWVHLCIFCEPLCTFPSPGLGIVWPILVIGLRNWFSVQKCRETIESSAEDFLGINIYDVYADICLPKAHAVTSQLAKAAGPLPISVGAYMHQVATEKQRLLNSQGASNKKAYLAICYPHALQSYYRLFTVNVFFFQKSSYFLCLHSSQTLLSLALLPEMDLPMIKDSWYCNLGDSCREFSAWLIGNQKKSEKAA